MCQRCLWWDMIGLWKVHAQRPEEMTRAQSSYSHKCGGRALSRSEFAEGLSEPKPVFSACYRGESRSLGK